MGWDGCFWLMMAFLVFGGSFFRRAGRHRWWFYDKIGYVGGVLRGTVSVWGRCLRDKQNYLATILTATMRA
mgnify:FL=1